MKYFIILSILSFFISCTENTQKTTSPSSESIETSTKDTLKTPSHFFPEQKTKVLVVGTFHFDYPGLDSHKTTPEDQIDVLKEPKKSEVTELVGYIKKFKPTKIAIEANANWNATQKLREYAQGQHRDKRDERYQLAMRTATELGVDTLYEVNAYSLRSDLYKKDSLFLKSITGDVNWDYEDPLWEGFENWMAYDDKLIPKMNLTEYFKHMNSRESHNYGYGIYLLGNFKSKNNQGADHLSIWWYNRNLRIFRNIIGITESPEDRILVVMGNGHAAILRNLFETSPNYEFVEFDSLE
ncbi:DUF5694 domain-containing protein [Marinirhabdus gelatinilytica]|uniref:Uncharacterized protein n=1 Tax=Marinirhabdus gelatinilytica TaxID=1703343 RepID=A0A370QAZ3_9FLAO|nr:DUF5694 domain-containing protein [Marinirhabdus gelatinilytica]RDK85532.1 hypothetical protein C8D94_103359 [Marinirhabdus gelatinilytica]